MTYPNEHYAFGMGQPQHPGMFFPHQLQHPSYGHPGLTRQNIMLGGVPCYAENEYAMHGMYFDDYEDGSEVTTRPRLTKDQVDFLENEFQKNPKPNSGHKKVLAMHTNLNLNRVANWFQNRRAKAKQQRKLEEYENSYNKEQLSSQQRSGSHPSDDCDDEEDLKQEVEELQAISRSDQSEQSRPKSSHSSSPVDCDTANLRQKGLASLQRAITAARAAQTVSSGPTEWSHDNEQSFDPPSSMLRQPNASSMHSSPRTQIHVPTAEVPEWPEKQFQPTWPTSPAATGDLNFDFGFETTEPQLQRTNMPLPSPTDSGSHSQVVSPQEWDNGMVIPNMAVSQNHFRPPLNSPGIHTPTYASSRRGSIADALTNNFEGFAIATPPMGLDIAESISSNTSDGGIDIASRRRRPRPAALTSASLRSRSYGALSAVSPTFRQGMPSASTPALRHVKSTGHSLHNHYAGIRKSSLPQRSPLNVSTFAEADFQHLMAEKAAELSRKQQLTPINTAAMNFQNSHTQPSQFCANLPNGEITMPQAQIQSPPATPYQQEFVNQTSSMLPPSIHAQYAHIPDYTPPYSAGPLTSSSWSDAPLTSPDVTGFPSMPYITSLTGEGNFDDLNQANWSYMTEHNSHNAINFNMDNKQAQFHIQEFPNQKQRHAQVAQQLSQARPRHYAFHNHKPEDFIAHT